MPTDTDDRSTMKALLQQSLTFESVSGNEAAFVRFIEQFARAQGFETDLFETDEAALAGDPLVQAKHIPLAGRPTLIIRLRGSSDASPLVFNAHSDVVAAPDPEKWRFGPWSGAEAEGRIFGRGACDVKGPLVSALWAMTRLQRGAKLPGDVVLELIPGEEDSVGLGTLTSVARGTKAGGMIVLEPTENEPRNASRGGCRFEIICSGKAVHGTVKWHGVDAIAELRRVLDSLAAMEAAWIDRDADPLFAAAPFTRPITVDKVTGGTWQGMVCDCATCAGYLELLPGDDRAAWRERFVETLRAEVTKRNGNTGDIAIRFTEDYPGNSTRPTSPLCQAAERAMGAPVVWRGFNSGCEAGLRAERFGTPTLVWGPGSLRYAHAVDESIGFDEVERVAMQFERVAIEWFSSPVPSPRGTG